MFYIQSYIRKPKITISDLVEVTQNPQKYFIEISSNQDLLKFSRDLNLQYIEGAIIIKYFDEVILDYRHWDLVDQLWAYFLNIIEEFLEEGKAQTSFPDCPIQLNFESISDDLLLFKVSSKSVSQWTLPKKEFFNALIQSAEYFFKTLIDLFGSNVDYKYELSKINELRNKVN